MAYDPNKGYPTRVTRDEVWTTEVSTNRPKLAPKITCEREIDSKTGESEGKPYQYPGRGKP